MKVCRWCCIPLFGWRRFFARYCDECEFISEPLLIDDHEYASRLPRRPLR